MRPSEDSSSPDSIPNTAASAASPSPAAIAAVVGGLVFLALLWYFGFVLLLWLLLIVAGIAAIGLAIGAADAKDKDTRHGLLVGAGASALAVFGLWWWIGWLQMDIPSLPRNADARRITEEYKDRVAFIQVAYTSREQWLFWQHTVAGRGQGSGILLANDRTRGLILTNRHVIDPTYGRNASNLLSLSMEAKLASEAERHSARPVAVHRSLDLALVLVERPFASRGAVRIANHRLLQQGEGVVALGNPLGIEFVTTEGIISGLRQGEIVTSCPISRGNSGGPLILKRRGLVAGINTLTFRGGQNINVAVPAEWAIRNYPSRSQDTSRPSSHPAGRLIETVIEAVFSSSEEDIGSWHWISHQSEATKLLNMVPIESVQ